MITSVITKIGFELRVACDLAQKLREGREQGNRVQCLNPDEEQRKQKKFEESIKTGGVFLSGRGIRIA